MCAHRQNSCEIQVWEEKDNFNHTTWAAMVWFYVTSAVVPRQEDAWIPLTTLKRPRWCWQPLDMGLWCLVRFFSHPQILISWALLLHRAGMLDVLAQGYLNPSSSRWAQRPHVMLWKPYSGEQLVFYLLVKRKNRTEELNVIETNLPIMKIPKFLINQISL